MQRKTKWCLAGGCSGVVLVLLGALLGWVAFPAVVEDQVAEVSYLKIIYTKCNALVWYLPTV